MELTIEKALQRAMAAQEGGKLQDVEHFIVLYCRQSVWRGV